MMFVVVSPSDRPGVQESESWRRVCHGVGPLDEKNDVWENDPIEPKNIAIPKQDIYRTIRLQISRKVYRRIAEKNEWPYVGESFLYQNQYSFYKKKHIQDDEDGR